LPARCGSEALSVPAPWTPLMPEGGESPCKGSCPNRRGGCHGREIRSLLHRSAAVRCSAIPWS
jgi:hypothetical protein